MEFTSLVTSKTGSFVKVVAFAGPLITPRPNPRNIVAHNMLHTFGHPVATCCIACCWINFENGQIFLTTCCNISGCCIVMYSFGHARATLLHRSMRNSSICAIQHSATYCNWVAKRVQHVVHNNVALCCVEILRSFGRLLRKSHNTTRQFCDMLH